jgi:hypothetical protein
MKFFHPKSDFFINKIFKNREIKIIPIATKSEDFNQ